MAEVEKLITRLDAVKDASMFEVRAAIDAALEQAVVVLSDLNGRLARLERNAHE